MHILCFLLLCAGTSLAGILLAARQWENRLNGAFAVFMNVLFCLAWVTFPRFPADIQTYSYLLLAAFQLCIILLEVMPHVAARMTRQCVPDYRM
ncbi:MAG TPA: hypothetical protein VJC16_01105 [Candidatus Nanoarchaeia archaeon]|nr:hypothetical protein [Candidatus Nanoarchaeia archaeon]